MELSRSSRSQTPGSPAIEAALRAQCIDDLLPHALL
jgi:hypothetical protein